MLKRDITLLTALLMAGSNFALDLTEASRRAHLAALQCSPTNVGRKPRREAVPDDVIKARILEWLAANPQRGAGVAKQKLLRSVTGNQNQKYLVMRAMLRSCELYYDRLNLRIRIPRPEDLSGDTDRRHDALGMPPQEY